MKKTLIITGMAFSAIITLQAQEITVKPVGVSVSTLRRSQTGQVINPLKDKASPEPFHLNGAALTPGTQVSLLVTLPDGAFALVGSGGPKTTGLKLKSLVDTSGKDLLTPPEGAIATNGFFAENRTALAMSEDQNTLFVVGLGIRAPRAGATAVKGEFLLDITRGKILTATQPFAQSGKIIVGDSTLLIWGKGSPRPPVPPGQGFNPGPTGPQKSTTLSEISKGIVKIEILDAKGNAVATINGPDTASEHGLSWSDNDTGPYKIVVSYIAPNTPVEQTVVPFEIPLGVSPE